MKNKEVLFILLIFGINFASAATFSLSDLLESIDSSTLVLGAIFIISFALCNFALSKFFREKRYGAYGEKYSETNRNIASVISFALSILVVYGINRSGFNVEDLLYGIGISGDLLPTLVTLILIAGSIFLVIKVGFYKTCLSLGGLLILVAIFTDWVYERGILAIIGAILLFIGIGIRQFGTKKERGK